VEGGDLLVGALVELGDLAEFEVGVGQGSDCFQSSVG